MKILLLGATGATGQHLAKQLLDRGNEVIAIVRTAEKLPQEIRQHSNFSLIRGAVLDMADKDIVTLVQGCEAIACCLGHTLSFQGIYGHPRRLVTESVRRLCEAVQINPPEKPIKFILMNSTGCRNNDIPEHVSFSQRIVVGLLSVLLPPHADNEDAADYLRAAIGQNHSFVMWAVVRPDGLINENAVSQYNTYASPIRSAIFNPGKTSRINVANFMADLILDPTIWIQWKGQMPVIYNIQS